MGLIFIPDNRPLLLPALTLAETATGFTNLPPWIKEFTLFINDGSTNGSSIPVIQLGTSAGYVTDGYSGSATHVSLTDNTTRGTSSTSGVLIAYSGGAASVFNAAVRFRKSNGNAWKAEGSFSTGGQIESRIVLSGDLTSIRLSTNSADVFDSGSISLALH